MLMPSVRKSRLGLRAEHMPTLRLGKHVLKSGERRAGELYKGKRACWLQVPPVTRLFSKRDVADCVLKPGIPDLNVHGMRFQVWSVWCHGCNIQWSTRGLMVKPVAAKGCPKNSPKGTGLCLWACISGTAVLRDSCRWIAAYLCRA